jgi:hypothetical protein
VWILASHPLIYDREIDTDLLDSEERDNFPETEENIDPQNSQQAQSINYSAIDYVAMGLDVAIDQDAALDEGILNVITNWNTDPSRQSSQDSDLDSSYPQLTKGYKMKIKKIFMYIFYIFLFFLCIILTIYQIILIKILFESISYFLFKKLLLDGK